MAIKKQARKMPEGVKRTLAAKRKTKTTTKRSARKVAEKVLKDSQTETVTLRIVNIIDADKLQESLDSPEGRERFEKLIKEQLSAGPRYEHACRANFSNPQNFGGFPHIPSKEQMAEQADNAAVDAFAEAMRVRMQDQRDKGYSGWNDPTQCDARKLARLYLDKLFGSADLTDLGNYNMMLFHFGGTGKYVLQQEVKARQTALAQERDNAWAQVKALEQELAQERATRQHVEGNLSRALGYIDRVNENDPELTPVVESIQHSARRRGPGIDLGQPYHTSMDALGLRR